MTDVIKENHTTAYFEQQQHMKENTSMLSGSLASSHTQANFAFFWQNMRSGHKFDLIMSLPLILHRFLIVLKILFPYWSPSVDCPQGIET